MKILQQCIYFPPEIGGLESHAYHLCRELVRAGDEVTMITSLSQPRLPQEEVVDGIRVLRRPLWSRSTWGWMIHTLATVPLHGRMARSVDILHAQTFASAVPGIVSRRRFRKPLVVTLHTSHFLRLASRPAWRPVLRRIIASADWLLAASEEIRDVALELYPHPRVEAIINGVDTELFRPVEPFFPPPAGDRPRIIVPRRLFEKNGVEYAIRAVPRLAALDPELLIVGDGPERKRLESLVRSLGLSDRVRFVGARANHEMPAFLASAEMALFPSLVEATSVAALEAMSCGLPVAAARVGGLPQIVDEEVGTLFEPADPVDLAEKVGALLRRPGLERIGERARQRVVERWSVQRLVERHREIYRTLLEETARR